MNRNNQITPHYESIEFNVVTATTDYDLDAQQATFLAVFGTLGRFPTYVSIRTNNTITVELNSASNHGITIASTDSPFVIDGVEITNLFITNTSGSTAAVKLFFQDTVN